MFSVMEAPRQRSSSKDDRALPLFDGVKIFSATMVAQRETLGEVVTRWIEARRGEIEVSDIVVTQSSDDEFHCIAISVFYRGTA
jgi:hypothetical protein